MRFSFLPVNLQPEILYKSKKLPSYKNAIFSIVFIFAFSLSVIGQDTTSTFSIDIHTGITASEVRGSGHKGFYKIGVIAGLGVCTALDEKWDAAMELNFVQKGSYYNPTSRYGYSKYKMSLNYAQIPLILRYRIHPKVSLSAGPAIGRLLSSKEEAWDGEYPSLIPFEKWELSAVLGAGYQLSEKFVINIRFDTSLLPIRKKERLTYYSLKVSQYSSSAALSFSYSIR